MAKGSKKKTAGRPPSGRSGRPETTSDSDDDGGNGGSVAGGGGCLDNASVISMQGSDNGSTVQEAVGGGGMDTSSSEEVFENKMKDAIELASQKSASGRVKALEALCQGLLKRYAPDFVESRRVTISDVVERALKKGKGTESTAAARLALILAMQLDDCEELYKDLRGTLVQSLTDPTEQPAVRSAVAAALAGLCFVGGGEMAEVVNTMATMEAIFTQSCPRHDGTVPSFSPEVLSLHTSCLSGWALLSTLLSPGQLFESVGRRVALMSGLFASPDLELRIAAGETTALLLENAYDYDEEYEPQGLDELLTCLKLLATDHSKSRSKKDRKEQRSSFRDILRGVEEGEPPTENIKFGREVLRIDAWYKKCQYDWFCKVMGPGMNYHLTVNPMLREILELGAPLPIFQVDSMHKPSKTERNAVNQQTFKLRTQTRGKNRDKRSAVLL